MGAKCCSTTLAEQTGIKIAETIDFVDPTTEVSEEPHNIKEVLILETHCSKKEIAPKIFHKSKNELIPESFSSKHKSTEVAFQNREQKIEPEILSARQPNPPLLWKKDKDSDLLEKKSISHSLQTKHCCEYSFTKLDISCFRGHRKDDINMMYKIMESIGRGTCGEVFKARQKTTKEIRAIKILNCSTVDASTKIVDEIDILKRLDHPNLLTLYEFCQSESKYFIITEYCKGGNLLQQYKKVEHIREPQVTGIMSQIFSALSYCHKQHLIHRDLKLENIAFKGNWIGSVVKIIDFGLSTILCPKDMLTESVGSLYYTAPEVLQMKEYNEKCDIWSCGVIMYFLLCGELPFNGVDKDEIVKKINFSPIKFEQFIWKSISKEAKDLVKKMLEKNPKIRISAIEASQHRWIKKFLSQVLKRPNASIVTLKKLQNFTQWSNIHKTILSYIAAQHINPKVEKKMRELFDEMDTDKNGQVSQEEIYEYLRKSGQPHTSAKAWARKILLGADLNKNGFLDYHEFLVANLGSETLLKPEVMKHAFEFCDPSGNGYISLENINKLFNSKEGAQIIKIASDYSFEGKQIIFYEEFVDMIKNYCELQSALCASSS